MGTSIAAPCEVPSGVVGVHSVPQTVPVRLSELLWGIDWHAAFPHELKPGIWADVASGEEIATFATEHFGSIFDGADSAGFWRDVGPARERYLQHVCDGFIVREGMTPIGVVICNPLDWSTYYLRMAAFLPAYQGQDLATTMVARLCRVLMRAGIARFEFDAAPSNARCISGALAFGFVVTGTTLSERWGALSRLTRYLDPSAEEAYLDRYCAAGRSHRDGRAGRAAARDLVRDH